MISRAISYKSAFWLISVGICSAILAGAQNPPAKSITVEGLFLTDSKGNTRGRLGVIDGVARFELLNSDNQAKLSLSLAENGAVAIKLGTNEKTHEAIELNVLPGKRTSVEVSANKSTIAGLGVNSDGSSLIWTKNPHKAEFAATILSDGTSHISINNDKSY